MVTSSENQNPKLWKSDIRHQSVASISENWTRSAEIWQIARKSLITAWSFEQEAGSAQCSENYSRTFSCWKALPRRFRVRNFYFTFFNEHLFFINKFLVTQFQAQCISGEFCKNLNKLELKLKSFCPKLEPFFALT